VDRAAGQLHGKAYYEILFWGGGHALQFTWTLLMLVVLAVAGERLRRALLLSPRVRCCCSRWRWLACSSRPMPTWPDVSSVEHRNLHTWAMRMGGGRPSCRSPWRWCWRWPPAPLARRRAPLRAALLSSVLLFAAGGVIGIFIGSNVRIPAHYHGCIVGVTLALMGGLPPAAALGYPRPQDAWRWQPWVYGWGS
jgi:hypothetical protein